MAVTTLSSNQAYQELRARLTLAVPNEFNFVQDTFEPWASTERPCLLFVDDLGSEMRLTYAELSERVNRVANVLRAHGVGPGDRVFIQVGRLPEWWETMLACLKIGAVAMPGTVQLQPKD